MNATKPANRAKASSVSPRPQTPGSNDVRDIKPPVMTLHDAAKLDLRLLTFRATREELLHLTKRHLFFGLFCSWVVGVGRYWDNPRVGFLQHLGIGSVIYVFILSLFLWLTLWPLRPRNWSYLRVVTFISLVSPPAIIYAIPVEKFFSLATADSINSWFLFIVALWRVALLIYFLRRVAKLDAPSLVVGTLLPLTLIIVTLTELNLEKAVFLLMGGLSKRTSSDTAFATLWLLSFVSLLLFVPLVVSYVVLIILKSISTRKGRVRAS
jgi:hypothetical protein